MIPKIIHYCWFGPAALDNISKRCLASWQKYCPEYSLMRWDENNFSCKENEYAAEAYIAQKWAFVSDYVRLAVLYDQGGIYLDTDVEIKRPFDDLLQQAAFMGFESSDKVATCVIAAEKHHPLIKAMLDLYEGKRFINDDGYFDETTNVAKVTALLLERGLKLNDAKQSIDGMVVYPREYFSPKDLLTGRINVTKNTYALHHFNASWMTHKQKYNTRLAQFIGPEATKFAKMLLKKGRD